MNSSQERPENPEPQEEKLAVDEVTPVDEPISEQGKRVLLVVVLCVLIGGGLWWAYSQITTISPPNLQTASADQVVSYLGQDRGFARMSVDEREQFLVDAYDRFAKGDSRAEFGEALRQMSPNEREIFTDAGFELFKDRFLEKAREFSRVPRDRQVEFLDDMIREFLTMRQQLAGYGEDNTIAEPFQEAVPTTTDGLTRAILDRTSARERAEAQPLVDALMARYKELGKSQIEKRLGSR